MIHVIAAIIKNDLGEILICQRGPGGSCAFHWEFPGGKMEQGETPEQCLIRECYEELQIEIKVDNFVANSTYSYPDLDIFISFYKATIIRGELCKTVHSDIKWVKPKLMTQYEFCPADVEVVQKLALE